MDLSNISSAFASFIDTLTRKPLATVFGLNLIGLFAGIGLLGYVALSDPDRTFKLVEYFTSSQSSIIEPIAVPIPPEEEAKRLQESIPRDKLTCAAIDEVGKQLDADRATFWTFSNGSYGLGGVPFNYANVHCPFVKEGIAFIPDDFQKIPNSISAETNAVLFPNAEATECGYWRRDQISSPYLRAGLKSLGSVEMVQCGVRDRRGIPIGKIVLSWRDHEARDIPAILKTLKTTGEAIGRFNTPSINLTDLPLASP
ncbi:hypothetical protein KX729_09300 [Rhizobium sp. XQZ8]|uniref:hypothetical protein n=1 Tax=Rhizobium populisoli TaxID=2859785 RepID=UPI001CA5AC22|nr:hypothetical protein [Rhizobium populisoli]MBW6421635.1 hypothetical protein [Rhizobium populisoli]